jgi:RHS repeat-associated protein
MRGHGAHDQMEVPSWHRLPVHAGEVIQCIGAVAALVLTVGLDNGLMWRWDADPFGTALPNQNPASLGTFIYNLRFPGQYYQAETGTNYNYFRDYDPAVGRYIESDPIGLRAGANTYVYARGNAVLFRDPLGLDVTMTCRPLSPTTFLGPISLKHCSVFVWHRSVCGQQRVVDAQFSVAGFTQSPTTDPNNQTYVDDRNAFYSGGWGDSNYNIGLPQGMTQSQFDAATVTSGSNYSLPGDYGLGGPNSNTAAASIITGARGSVPYVPLAPGLIMQPTIATHF